MKVSLISNININPINKILSSSIEITEIPGYNNWISELLNPNSHLNKNNPSVIFLIIDGYTYYEEYQKSKNSLNEIKNIVKNFLVNNPQTLLFISDLDFYPNIIGSLKSYSYDLNKFKFNWLEMIVTLSNEFNNCYNFNLSEVFDFTNKKDMYSEKLWYLGGVRYTPLASEMISKKIQYTLYTLYVSRKKCLVLDLDNTLWGGVLGDDGISGIKIDKTGYYSCYYDFQKELKRIKETGVILAIASKNNLDSVIYALNKNPNMFLKEDDFSIIMANWKPKSQNIIEISKKLNISTDSMVMIDDSVFEQEEIKNTVKDIDIPNFPNDPTLLRSFAIDIFDNYFKPPVINQSDLNKSLQIKSKMAFDNEKETTNNIDDFLNSLNMQLEISINDINNIDRLAQITQKTNQFNLTDERYTSQKLEELIKSNHIIFSGRVKDKLGDHGIVLMTIIYIDNSTAEIKNYYMSCRVFGRNLEFEFLESIINYLRGIKIENLKAVFTSTKKNKNFSEFYLEAGLCVDDFKNNSFFYSLNLKKNKKFNSKKISKVSFI